MPDLIAASQRGVLLSSALPIPFPTISLHESFAHPTSMFLRNLMAMDTEEMIRAQPMDAVILVGGCDKTVPAQLMGAISADVPAVQLVTGPMVAGSHRGVRVGACTDCRGYWAKYRAGEIDIEEIAQVGDQLVPSAGVSTSFPYHNEYRSNPLDFIRHAGSWALVSLSLRPLSLINKSLSLIKLVIIHAASTMACITEALGLAPLGSACPPANSSQRLRVAELTGKLATTSPPRPSEILTRKSFENAITVLQSMGGSTNAVVHLLAIAGRVEGVDLTLDGESVSPHTAYEDGQTSIG